MVNKNKREKCLLTYYYYYNYCDTGEFVHTNFLSRKKKKHLLYILNNLPGTTGLRVVFTTIYYIYILYVNLTWLLTVCVDVVINTPYKIL